jgi:hypothetical protein
MARRKNLPEAVRVKCHLAERLREIRVELFGERGGSEMARRLGVPIRTWYNYESGVTVPAEVLLRFLELTTVEPVWLLHGQGEKYRAVPPPARDSGTTVEVLLRTALQHLERKAGDGLRLVRAPGLAGSASVPEAAGAQRAWLEAEREGRCIEVEDDAMAPILAEGARVAYAARDEAIETLEGALVVAWVQGRALVRWFRRSGAYGLLRAENPEFSPTIQLLDLSAPPHECKLRRVLWTSTPH